VVGAGVQVYRYANASSSNERAEIIGETLGGIGAGYAGVRAGAAVAGRYLARSVGGASSTAAPAAATEAAVTEAVAGEAATGQAAAGEAATGEAATGQAAASGPRVTGNLPETGQTSLYAKVTDTGAFLKWGTSINPAGRYSCACLTKEGARLGILYNYDSKEAALAAERYLVSRWPGPQNFEKWAGKVPTNESPSEGLNRVLRGNLWDKDW
jgi:hypothetical protein